MLTKVGNDTWIPRSDAMRLFVTALLVYTVFWNPLLQSSMTWNFLDAAVSFVDTGRWEMAHASLYEAYDTATFRGRLVSAEPPGMAVLLMPLYVVWRVIVGPANTAGAFQAFNAFGALGLGATASALVVVQVAYLAGWLGAGRRGRLWTAILVAFGTQNFFFGTVLFKENLAALAVLIAFRLAVIPGPHWRLAAGGAVAGLATAIANPAGLLVPLVTGMVGRRRGIGAALWFLAGSAPGGVAIAAYNTWLFGYPWRPGYCCITGIAHPGFVWPKTLILLELIVGLEGGLLLYAPFFLFAFAGLAWAWRSERRAEAGATALFLGGIWIAAAAWQSQFSEHASWATGLGPRMLFPAMPLLAAFAGPPLERAGRGALLFVSIPSLVCGYLSAQAGFIPGGNSFLYAGKTWISGTGMGVLFKEALPAWLGLDTLHTMVSRPDVHAADILLLLQTPEGWVLLQNQLLCLGANLVMLSLVGWIVFRLWKQ